MPADPPSRVTPAPDSANENEKTKSAGPKVDPGQRGPEPGSDPDLRRMLKWVFGALILTVLFAIVVVEVTLRWFGP